MNRKAFLSIFIIVFLFISARNVFAQSTYVLPYPSAMPGNAFYTLNLIKEEILKYWYFGDLAQFEYNLSQSDRYLVEAKTLFDYKQYLLGYRALQKSNSYFEKLSPLLKKANKDGKNISEKEQILKSASLKHMEELEKMSQILPDVFVWKPESGKETKIDFKELIRRSESIRNE